MFSITHQNRTGDNKTILIHFSFVNLISIQSFNGFEIFSHESNRQKTSAKSLRASTNIQLV